MYKCSRCNGTGRLSCYNHVQGGVCFKCLGTGSQATKPAAPSKRFAVMAFNVTTNQMEVWYNKRAATEKEAINKAMKTYQTASDQFKALWDLSKLTVVEF